MTKIYTSYTHVAFSVLIEGKPKRVSFSPRTGSGSIFYTEDEKLQEAIEKHPAFGQKFFLSVAQNEQKPAKPAVAKKLTKAAAEAVSPVAEAAPEEPVSEEETKEEPKGKEIPYSNLSDAKEYLAKTFEISRSQLRSKEAIKKYAAMHGIIFVGIDD